MDSTHAHKGVGCVECHEAAQGDADGFSHEGYFIATVVEVLGNNAPDPNEQEYLARAVPAWAPYFQRYGEGAPFLFDL